MVQKAAGVNEMKALLLQSIRGVEKWVEDHDYKGYEPFDGLNSYLRPLTFGNLFLDRLLMQLVRQSPVNLRPLLGVKPLVSTIGRGYMASGYLTMLAVTGEPRYKDRAVSCLDWLMANKSPGFEDYSWGKHFDFASRGGRYPKLEPITVWTCLIGRAFLEGYQALGEQRFLDVASSVCRWILALPRNVTDTGVCINYTISKTEKSTIHNHNMIAAAMLAGTARHTRNEACLDLAREAMKFSCSRQLADGGWYYGEDANLHWIDNFHTGYNLDALKSYMEDTGDTGYTGHLRRGFEFYKRNFFEENGRPKYYHTRTYPVDSQCAAQAVETLSNFAEFDKESLGLAQKVAQWTIANMQDPKGHFYYRQYPFGIMARTPMLHWSEATTYKALAMLIFKLERTGT